MINSLKFVINLAEIQICNKYCNSKVSQVYRKSKHGNISL